MIPRSVEYFSVRDLHAVGIQCSHLGCQTCFAPGKSAQKNIKFYLVFLMDNQVSCTLNILGYMLSLLCANMIEFKPVESINSMY